MARNATPSLDSDLIADSYFSSPMLTDEDLSHILDDPDEPQEFNEDDEPLPYAFHMKGKHDQSTHGHGFTNNGDQCMVNKTGKTGQIVQHSGKFVMLDIKNKKGNNSWFTHDELTLVPPAINASHTPPSAGGKYYPNIGDAVTTGLGEQATVTKVHHGTDYVDVTLPGGHTYMQTATELAFHNPHLTSTAPSSTPPPTAGVFVGQQGDLVKIHGGEGTIIGVTSLSPASNDSLYTVQSTAHPPGSSLGISYHNTDEISKLNPHLVVSTLYPPSVTVAPPTPAAVAQGGTAKVVHPVSGQALINTQKVEALGFKSNGTFDDSNVWQHPNGAIVHIDHINGHVETLKPGQDWGIDGMNPLGKTPSIEEIAKGAGFASGIEAVAAASIHGSSNPATTPTSSGIHTMQDAPSVGDKVSYNGSNHYVYAVNPTGAHIESEVTGNMVHDVPFSQIGPPITKFKVGDIVLDKLNPPSNPIVDHDVITKVHPDGTYSIKNSLSGHEYHNVDEDSMKLSSIQASPTPPPASTPAGSSHPSQPIHPIGTKFLNVMGDDVELVGYDPQTGHYSVSNHTQDYHPTDLTEASIKNMTVVSTPPTPVAGAPSSGHSPTPIHPIGTFYHNSSMDEIELTGYDPQTGHYSIANHTSKINPTGLKESDISKLQVVTLGAAPGPSVTHKYKLGDLVVDNAPGATDKTAHPITALNPDGSYDVTHATSGHVYQGVTESDFVPAPTVSTPPQPAPSSVHLSASGVIGQQALLDAGYSYVSHQGLELKYQHPSGAIAQLTKGTGTTGPTSIQTLNPDGTTKDSYNAGSMVHQIQDLKDHASSHGASTPNSSWATVATPTAPSQPVSGAALTAHDKLTSIGFEIKGASQTGGYVYEHPGSHVLAGVETDGKVSLVTPQGGQLSFDAMTDKHGSAIKNMVTDLQASPPISTPQVVSSNPPPKMVPSGLTPKFADVGTTGHIITGPKAGLSGTILAVDYHPAQGNHPAGYYAKLDVPGNKKWFWAGPGNEVVGSVIEPPPGHALGGLDASHIGSEVYTKHGVGTLTDIQVGMSQADSTVTMSNGTVKYMKSSDVMLKSLPLPPPPPPKLEPGGHVITPNGPATVMHFDPTGKWVYVNNPSYAKKKWYTVAEVSAGLPVAGSVPLKLPQTSLASSPSSPTHSGSPKVGAVTPGAVFHELEARKDTAVWKDARSVTLNALSASEKSAIVGYTGNAFYSSLNHALWSNNASGIASYAAKIKALDSGLAKASTPEDAIIYRGSKIPCDKNNLAAMVGKQIEMKGYSSCSYNLSKTSGWAGGSNLVLKIKVPKGSQVLDVRSISLNSSEGEFLMARGMKIHITKVTWDGNSYHSPVAEVDLIP